MLTFSDKFVTFVWILLGVWCASFAIDGFVFTDLKTIPWSDGWFYMYIAFWPFILLWNYAAPALLYVLINAGYLIGAIAMIAAFWYFGAKLAKKTWR